MKRSRHITLLVLGTAALLAGCSDDRADIMQKRYASNEDCVRDWGEQQVCSRSSSGGGFLGPRYYWNHGGASPMAVMPDGTEKALTNSHLTQGRASLAQGTATVAQGVRVGGGSSFAGIARGGFGSSAHASSGGG